MSASTRLATFLVSWSSVVLLLNVPYAVLSLKIPSVYFDHIKEKAKYRGEFPLIKNIWNDVPLILPRIDANALCMELYIICCGYVGLSVLVST